jgi:hypothetical protein
MSEMHIHPQPRSAVIFGRRLSVGEIIQEGDVYDSTTGKWEECPSCVGQTINKSCTGYWVRPEKPAQ